MKFEFNLSLLLAINGDVHLVPFEHIPLSY